VVAPVVGLVLVVVLASFCREKTFTTRSFSIPHFHPWSYDHAAGWGTATIVVPGYCEKHGWSVVGTAKWDSVVTNTVDSLLWE
jgi:hypothetical protein